MANNIGKSNYNNTLRQYKDSLDIDASTATEGAGNPLQSLIARLTGSRTSNDRMDEFLQRMATPLPSRPSIGNVFESGNFQKLSPNSQNILTDYYGRGLK